MSRKVITDLVLPIVIQRLQGMGVNITSYDSIEDNTLTDYFEEQLHIILGVCGKVGNCEDLEQAIKESKARNPEGFKELINQLLDKYINLRTKLAQIKKLDTKKKKEIPGPPDRFKKQLEEAQKVWGRQT